MTEEAEPIAACPNLDEAQFQAIDPVALQLGPVAIHWYGLTYLAAFGLFMLLGRARLKHEPFASIRQPSPWTSRDVEDILFLGVMGVVLGGRLGFQMPSTLGSHWRPVFTDFLGRQRLAKLEVYRWVREYSR